MARYKLFSVEQAKAAGLPEPWGEDWDDVYDEYQSYLYKHDADNGFVFIASDGGEPEDNSFRRDWSWVVNELNTAYEDGRMGRE